MKKFSSFHLVSPSFIPLFTSFSFLSFALGVIIIVRTFYCTPFLVSLFFLCFSSYLWGKEVHREGCLEGFHSFSVVEGFKIGMVFFIFSEFVFFFGIFWGYFHLAESPSIDLGGVWPPLGVVCFDPLGIPFLNTIILISSGVSATWCHHETLVGSYVRSLVSLIFTISCGLIFSSLQILEYYVSTFTISCSSYSSIYYLGTGFHGFHVLVGTVLLIICFFRFLRFFVSPNHNAGFECSLWYWHFVDVVWFFLYLVFYWWGI